ncbi:outer membrane usher protein LpfC [Salmonella enterica]|nr:outer membrane usher protein LpfC [Salmonella enterica]EJE9570490.1 outer membrane usher protein LpfC [Salmonella enterica]EJE9579171.1 outer membrane usher protein LpfC [Salmonella enterica]EJE9583710.1 outer membrane usher protein LpfC [Salmonella enterica]EJE9601729.1 outer membrane usher protein LpfC [Salmonella enterica]
MTWTHLPLGNKTSRFTQSALALMIAGTLPAYAGTFNPRFLEDVPGIDQHVDLSMYESNKAEHLPGKYRVSVVVNEKKMESRTLEFKAATEAQRAKMGESLVPCLSRVQLEDMGVRIDSFPALKMAPPEACVAFDDIIPQAASHFDFADQTLIMSFPQAAMKQTARGTVPESQWDEGVNALLVDYNFSGSNASYDAHDSETSYNSDSYYLNLRSGMNLGAWRLRNYSTWTRNDGNNTWDNIGTSLSRAIVPLKSQLTLGDTSTAGDIFDSVQMRGVQLTSDEEMLPDSQRGFAPVIRGIAKSNAEVTVEQNNYVIYRTFIQPGAFEINDLYPTSNSGDLTVTIKESDGSEQKFVQPFSSVALLQREGHLKYSLSAGEYRAGNYNSAEPKFGQLDAMYGLPYGFTVYGGAIFSDDYYSLAGGLGKNFGYIGAISIDVTQAKSKLANEENSEGQSYRFLYSKSFNSGTDFRLLGYKYSTSGYYTFQEATDVRSDADSSYSQYHKRSQIQGNVTQQLGAWGSVYFNVTQQDYWNDEGKQRSLNAGYNGRIGRVNYSVAYTWTKSPEWDESDRLLSFSMSIPLGRVWSNYHLTTDQHGRTNQQLGVSGTALEDHNLNYSVQEGYGSNGVGNSGSVNLDYQGGVGSASLGYNYNRDGQQVNYGLRGGVIAHSEGITLSQPLGESMAIISAPGARGAHVINNGGVEVDWMGNAVVPYLTPYRETEVSLRSDSLNNQVDLDTASVNVVPTRGAIVRARFDTRVGYRVLMNLTQANGKAVPFGATATLLDTTKESSSIVGEDGQLYISGMPEKGALQVNWGKDQAQQCRVAFTLPEQQDNTGVVMANAVCR